MELKVGDVVEFKKYEDMTDNERLGLDKRSFPHSGKISYIYSKIARISIKGKPYSFLKSSVARVISDINSLKAGDEVLAKVTIKKVFDGFIQINSSVDKTDVVKILKRKEPEHFIVKDDNYGMYIISEDMLSYDKSKAKAYDSRIEANDAAADMHLNAWEVIKYDD